MKNPTVVQQLKSRPPKGWLFLFLKKSAMVCLILLLGLTSLGGCAQESTSYQEISPEVHEQISEASTDQPDAGSTTEPDSSAVEEAESEASEASEADSAEAPADGESDSSQRQDEPAENASAQPRIEFEVKSGSYLVQILEEIASKSSSAGIEISAQQLVDRMDQMADAEMDADTGIGESADAGLSVLGESLSLREGTAYVLEGYIAPGIYQINPSGTPEEWLSGLGRSWENILDPVTLQKIEESGLSFHEVLTMASIIEFESSQTEDDSVKYLVSSVVNNRLGSGTPLEMDVTVFYLQEGFEPYRNPADFEAAYNTYDALSLPPGPICTPSLESIRAALGPADTDYFFFIYDGEGNYYFAEDYETHLVNVETYLD